MASTKTSSKSIEEKEIAKGAIGENVRMDGKYAEVDRSGFEQVGDDFASLGTDQLFYNPHSGARCQGYLLGMDEMGHDTPNGPFHVLFIRLTKPSVGAVGDGDDVQLVPVDAGTEVMVILTEKLKKLVPYAVDPDQVGEVVIDPIAKIPIHGGKKSMWRYDVRISKTPVPRASIMAAAWGDASKQLDAAPKGAAALPAKK